MKKVKFIKDMFISNIECIEEGTVLNLKEEHEHFAIYFNNGNEIRRFDYGLKEEIYKNFKIIGENINVKK